MFNYDDFDKLLSKKEWIRNWFNKLGSCSEYAACKEQMGNTFGVIPLSPLMLYQGPKANHGSISYILTLHRGVRESNCPNYMGIRIPVASKLKIRIIIWQIIGTNSWLTYWNLASRSISTGVLSCSLLRENHASGREHAHYVQCYIQEELNHGAMLGPFVQKPISLLISPFMTREKPDSDVRHTIVDLSWPKNFWVNTAVQKNTYMGSNFVLNYPSVDDIVKKLIELGPGSLLYKVDIS